MNKSGPYVNHKARAEDVHWLAETGEDADNAALRLGITYTALEAWARKHAPDDWALLIARRPRDWNMRNGWINQYGRSA